MLISVLLKSSFESFFSCQIKAVYVSKPFGIVFYIMSINSFFREINNINSTNKIILINDTSKFYWIIILTAIIIDLCFCKLNLHFSVYHFGSYSAYIRVYPQTKESLNLTLRLIRVVMMGKGYTFGRKIYYFQLCEVLEISRLYRAMSSLTIRQIKSVDWFWKVHVTWW